MYEKLFIFVIEQAEFDPFEKDLIIRLNRLLYQELEQMMGLFVDTDGEVFVKEIKKLHAVIAIVDCLSYSLESFHRLLHVEPNFLQIQNTLLILLLKCHQELLILHEQLFDSGNELLPDRREGVAIVNRYERVYLVP